MNKALKLKWDKKSAEHEGVEVHIEHNEFGYSTLCGLGSEGSGAVSGAYLERTNKKVDCQACLNIYNFCKSITL